MERGCCHLPHHGGLQVTLFCKKKNKQTTRVILFRSILPQQLSENEHNSKILFSIQINEDKS